MRLCDHCGACYEDEFDLCAYDGTPLRHAFEGTRVLENRYRLDLRIASGGMGEVYRATHLGIGSTVAVKLMRQAQEAGGSPRRVAIARFHREAMILGQIKHPNAVLVMDFGVERRTIQDIPYLVTEFLNGESLRDRLQTKKRLSIAEAERIVSPLCEAVEEAHRMGVVHRDIKPSNVFLERVGDGTEIVKVLDFGIARFMTDEQPERPAILGEAAPGDTIPDPVQVDSRDTIPDDLTLPGAVLGTIAYMPPEQLRGEAATTRSDIYAIGTLVHQLLSGEVPFTGSSEEIIHRKLSAEAPPLAGVPQEVAEVIARSLARDPVARTDTVRAISAALKRCASEQPGGTVREPALALAVQLGALSSAIVRLASDIESWIALELDEHSYQRARDRLLTLDMPLSRALNLAERCPPVISGEESMLKEVVELDEAIETMTRALRMLADAKPTSEHARFLSVLGSRHAGSGAAISRRVRERLTNAPKRDDGQLSLELANKPAQARILLEELSARLLSKSTLQSADAMDSVFQEHLALMREQLDRTNARDPLLADLVLGLWEHADTLLLRELFPIGAAPGLLPSLVGVEGDVPRFAELARMFTVIRASDPRALEKVEESLLEHDAATQRMLWRCLLLHPAPMVRARALEVLPLSELWTVLCHPQVPLAYQRAIFVRLYEKARAEHLKVAFLCLTDALRGAKDPDAIAAAFGILATAIAHPLFTEDPLFQTVLAIDGELRVRCAKLSIATPVDEAYVERMAAFAQKSPQREVMPENVADIPLAVHRELARRGGMIRFYISHSVDAIARETIPYLLKLDEVTQFLLIPTINKSVLVTLARQSHYFRKEAARLALVHNPKTPIQIVRRYLPFLSQQQLASMAADRSLGIDVRELAQSHLRKLDRNFE